MKNTKVQLLIIISLFTIVNLVSYYSQDRINANDGKGADGRYYYEMAEMFSQHKEIISAAPYIYRIGTPFLASIVDKDNILQGFFIANLIANFLSCILLFWFLRLYIKSFPIVIILITLYLLHWLYNTRFIYFYPALTDPWSTVFFLTGLLLIEKFKHRESVVFIVLLSISTFVGILFREYILLIPISFLFINNPLSNKYTFYVSFKKMFSNKLIIIPLIAGIAGIITTHLVTTTNEVSYSFILSVVTWLHKKSLVHYIHAWFLAVGPIIVLFLFFYKDIFKFLYEHQYSMAILLAGSILSYIAGSDTERFLIWLMPIILLLVGLAIENHISIFKNLFFTLPLIFFQCLSMRAFLPTVQPYSISSISFPILTVIGNGDFLNLFSYHGNRKFEFISFVEYTIVIGFLMCLLRYYYFKKKEVII